MYRLPNLIAALLLLADIGGAAAAQQIPPSLQPGRERDRFTESPVERFMQAGPTQPPLVVELWPNGGCEPRRPHRSKARARRSC
jgi:hypothetical protein